jgi:quinol monooxygenase YgiN
MTRPIHVITMAEALPEHAAEVCQILTRAVELARQEEGCLRMDLYRDSRRPLLLNTIECWESLEAHRRHLDSPLISTTVMALLGKMKGLPDIRVLDPQSEFSE